MMHIADDQDALLDYLYDEGDPAARLKIATHLQECASCSVAALELKTVRGMLTTWKPPAAQLGFRIVQDAVSPSASQGSRARGGWSWGWGPTTRQRRWIQAAAAVLLFVAGMAASQLQVDYSDGALTVRTGPATPPAPTARTASIQLPPSPETAVAVPEAVARQAPESTEQLLQRVRAMITESETRQQRELALRLSQVAGEVDTQHQADLLRIQQSFGQQQEMMDYLVRTAGSAR